MKRIIGCAVLLAASGLSGCGLPGTFGAQSFIHSGLSGGNFAAELAKAYQERAADAAENDVNWILAGMYADKGRAAAVQGAAVLPSDPNTYYESPAFRVGVNSAAAATYKLADRRSQLIRALDANRDAHPKECAQAQAHYDWLVDEVYQNTPPTPAEGQADIGVKTDQWIAKCLGSAPAPVTISHAQPATADQWVVYFGWDKANLTPEAKRVVDAAAQAANTAAKRVAVTGHTDTSGSDAYNNVLSTKRAKTVASQLKADGARTSAVAGHGEKDLAKSTADGVREPLNRRATLQLGQ